MFGAATLTPSHEEDLYLYIVIPFVSLKKQGETLFQLICCERKILFWLKNELKKTDYKRSEQGHPAL